MKIKKKVIIPLAVVLVAAIAGGSAVAVNSSKPVVKTVETTTIESGDLINSVSVTGMVESDDSVNVYTTLNYPIKVVNVEVGDTVAEGDVLCQLDTANLEASIAQSQASVNQAQAKANHALAVAEKDLETAKFNTEGNYNSALLNADNAVKTAENGVATAENNIRSAQSKLNDARKTLRDLRDDKKQADDDESFDDAITAAQQAVVQAEIALETAQVGKENADLQLTAAKDSQRAVKMQTQEAEITSNDAVTNAKLNANLSDQYIAIEKLKKDLADATIIAPVNGTVTAVMAKEGAAGAGLLFVIEDTTNLKVVTKVKEYDIGSVHEGLPVTIKADGTGDEEFTGVVSKIAPTSLKDTLSGKNVDTTTPEFSTEVKVTSKSQLRIGMNARLNIITEEKKGAISVPFESIVTNEAGETVIFLMAEQENGTFLAKSVPVTTGMETDIAVEITGDSLKDGDVIITTTDGLVDGMQVTKLDQAAIDQAIMA